VLNLDIGDVSKSQTTGNSTFLFVILEKAIDCEIDEDSLKILKERTLHDRLEKERQFHKVSYHRFHDGFNAESNACINWQLVKIKKSKSGGTSGGQ